MRPPGLQRLPWIMCCAGTVIYFEIPQTVNVWTGWAGRLQSCSIRAVGLEDGRTPRLDSRPRLREGDVLSRERRVGADSTAWKDFAIVLTGWGRVPTWPQRCLRLESHHFAGDFSLPPMRMKRPGERTGWAGSRAQGAAVTPDVAALHRLYPSDSMGLNLGAAFQGGPGAEGVGP